MTDIYMEIFVYLILSLLVPVFLNLLLVRFFHQLFKRGIRGSY